MADKIQTRENHTRIDPPYHFFILPVFALTFILSIVMAVRHPGFLHIWLMVFNFALILFALRARMYAARVQDRVIRLEERLRLMAVLPESQRSQILQLREGQLIALRFASDEELPSLVDQTVSQKWKGKEIKQAIKNWRPDHWRV